VLVALPVLIPGAILVVVDGDYAALAFVAYLAIAPIALGSVLASRFSRRP
jgi:hypothetical protein